MALVDPAVSRSTSWVDTILSTERTKMQRYYDGQLPKRQHEGSSSYVSPDVQDGVDSMKSQLLEVFGGQHDIVRFKPLNEADVDVTRLETSYISYLIMEENKGFEVFEDVIDDALKNRNGVVQYYWEERLERDEHSVHGMCMDDAQALASQEDVELNLELDEDDGSYKGTWTRLIDSSGLRIENVPPEEYFSDGTKKRREDGVRGRKTLKTRSELVKEGYPRDKVAKIGASNELEFDSERQIRDQDTSDRMPRDAAQPENELVMVYETFINLALGTGGTATLYRIVHAGGQLFEIDEVARDNFLDFKPLRRPHSQFGNNYAKRIVPTQNARTVLMRSILDHTATTTNPRWTVLNNSLTNPKELLENRLRGIVNVKSRDAIGVLPYPQMNQFVFPTMEMLKSSKEETTGLSSLSQGLNKDAISSQNSQGMVNDLVNLSQVRQKIIARNFAMFVHDLFLACRRVVIENQCRKKVWEFNNEFVAIDPKLWTPTRMVQVSLHVGYGEQEKEAAKYAQLWGLLSHDPKASLFCPPDKQYKLLSDGLKRNGFMNVNDYLITPDKVQPPGPDPLAIKKLEIEEKKAEASMLTAQAAMAKSQGRHEIDMLKTQVQQMLAQIKEFSAHRDADRKDLDIQNKVDVAQRETALLEQAPPEAQHAIISPR